MKRGRLQPWRRPQPSARAALLTFLRANFQVATREQRMAWFQTADREDFEILLDQLFTQAMHDFDARQRLEDIAAKVRAHIHRQSTRPIPDDWQQM